MSGVSGVLFASRVKECEGFDIPLSVFVGPSRKELRARVKARSVDHDLPFVVETTADSLVLVGFTPLGTKAFTLVRKGTDVQVDALTGPPIVPPHNVMSDVLAMSTPSTCSSTPDGLAAITFENWQISDTCSNGRPLKRQITRQPPSVEKGETGPDVEVEYLEDAIMVRQHRCHYSARYVLQASAPLAAPPAAPVKVPVVTPTAKPAAAPGTAPVGAPSAAPTVAPAAAPAAPAPAAPSGEDAK